MPPLVIAIAIGAGLYAGYRAAALIAGRLAVLDKADSDAAQGTENAGEPGSQAKDLGTLERDPASGVFRPRGHE